MLHYGVVACFLPATLTQACVTETPETLELIKQERALSAYLLGTLEFTEFTALQRRLVYEIAGERDGAAVILCDHPPGVTIGREGSRGHIRPAPEELFARGLSVRWVSRGGGAILHVAGQVACYPIFSLDACGLTPAGFVHRLRDVACALVHEYDVEYDVERPEPTSVRIQGRRLAEIGIAVRGDVTCFGLVVNVDPDLAVYRDIKCDAKGAPMTSLARESQLRVRVGGVRQRLLELVAMKFGFSRVSVFHTHPGITPPPIRRYAATHSS